MRPTGTRGVVAALLSVWLVLLPTAPAWAHATLIDTLPADGTVLEAEPAEVVLHFSEPVGTALGTVEVLAPDGSRVDTGDVAHRDSGRTLARALEPGLGDGTFTVLWRVVSGDSHPITGSSTFSIGQPSATAAVTQDPDSAGAAGSLQTLARLVLYAGLVLLVGGLAFLLVLWPAGWADRAARQVVWAGWGAATVATAAALLLQGPYAAGLPVTSALDPSLVRDVLSTRFGLASGARLLLLAASAALLLRLDRLRRPPALATAAGLATGLLITTSAVGHAAAGRWPAVALPADALHLAAAATWLGGLVVLGTVLLRRRPADLAAVLPRWSTCAAGAVGVLVATGAFASWREVGELGALTSTSYGRLLLVKVTLVAGMLALGATGRSWVRRHHSLPVVHAAGPGAVEVAGAPPRPAPAATDVARLRRWVLLEAATAVAVLAVTAALVETTPARVSYAPGFTATAVVVTGELRAQVDVAPARTGLNDVHVAYTDASGAAVDVAEASARWTRLGGNEAVPVELVRTGLGRYERLRVVLPTAGSWQLTLTTRTSDIDVTSTRFTVRVR